MQQSLCEPTVNPMPAISIEGLPPPLILVIEIVPPSDYSI